MVEQKGCPYCKRMHEEHLRTEEVCKVMRPNFAVLQINLRGAREVTDFDGKALPENRWARGQKLDFTPAMAFYAERDGKIREILRMVGFSVRDVDGKVLKGAVEDPKNFAAMLRFVHERGYEKTTFRDWLKKRS